MQKQLLQDTDIPVTDVAMQSGYQNVSYFIRSFQKAYAVSPLKYRKIIIADKLIQEAQQSFYDGTIIDKYTIRLRTAADPAAIGRTGKGGSRKIKILFSI